MVVLPKLCLLFNLVIADFLTVLFMKGLLFYLQNFCFKGANFSSVKLKVISKLLRECSLRQIFYQGLLKKFTIKINNDKIIFYFYL